jgi:lipopolysaccharide export system permease protein
VLILDRHLIGDVFKFFGIILVTVISIFLAIDFFEKVDDFIEAGVAMQRLGLYFLLRIPFVIGMLLPMTLFLSVLVALGLMNKRNELLAMRVGGVSMIFFLRSILLLGVLFALMLFIVSDILVPISLSRANQIYSREVKKEEVVTSREKNIWIKGNRSIAHIQYYNTSARKISGITLYFFDERFRLVRQIDAASATFRDGKWIFDDLLEQTLSSEGGEYNTVFPPQQTLPMEILPEDLARAAKKSEEMNLPELREYIRTVEKEGYDAIRYRVDLHAKIAFPFVCIILCLLALGIGTKPNFKDHLFVVIAIGVGTAFLYWTLNSFCLSLGYGGVLPPIVAAWTANSVFLCSSVVVLSNQQ